MIPSRLLTLVVLCVCKCCTDYCSTVGHLTPRLNGLFSVFLFLAKWWYNSSVLFAVSVSYNCCHSSDVLLAIPCTLFARMWTRLLTVLLPASVCEVVFVEQLVTQSRSFVCIYNLFKDIRNIK
jgi:hypothetical protein